VCRPASTTKGIERGKNGNRRSCAESWLVPYRLVVNASENGDGDDADEHSSNYRWGRQDKTPSADCKPEEDCTRCRKFSSKDSWALVWMKIGDDGAAPVIQRSPTTPATTRTHRKIENPMAPFLGAKRRKKEERKTRNVKGRNSNQRFFFEGGGKEARGHIPPQTFIIQAPLWR